MVAGATVVCGVIGGPADVDFLWRAAFNPVFAEGVVRTGADGTGAFSFTVPVEAAGSPVSVELVAWTAPVVVGMAEAALSGGPIPAAIPAGVGPFGTTVPGGLVALLLVVGWARRHLMQARSVPLSPRPR